MGRQIAVKGFSVPVCLKVTFAGLPVVFLVYLGWVFVTNCP